MMGFPSAEKTSKSIIVSDAVFNSLGQDRFKEQTKACWFCDEEENDDTEQTLYL